MPPPRSQPTTAAASALSARPTRSARASRSRLTPARRGSNQTAGQRSLDELGTPLHEVTFCVLDLETTGTGADDTITELAAVRVRGGEVLGSWSTLVDPGQAIPPSITLLTGITEAMVARAPRLELALPTFHDFVGPHDVLVGHNIRFDVGFLQRGAEQLGLAPLQQRQIDTLALSRRLLADEVPDHRLGTLAHHYRLRSPSHRALADVEATVDLLHLLIERATAFGVCGLDDLTRLPTMAGHPQAHKLALTSGLPRQAGVYLFCDRDDQVLYVGKATNLRSRVRSYFSSDSRRKIPQLLRETHHIRHIPCPSPLEAEVTELRLIQTHRPRFNRQGKRRTEAWLRLSLDEPWPRLVAARSRSGRRNLHLGPFPGRRSVISVIEAIHSVTALRRCTHQPGRRGAPENPCTPAQLGVAMCPCAQPDPVRYAAVVELVRRGLTDRPDLLLDRLADRLAELAAQQRFEEAAAMRDRAAALSHALARQRRIDMVSSGELTVRVGSYWSRLSGGRLVACGRDEPGSLALVEAPTVAAPADRTPGHEADEALVIGAWLDRHAGRYQIEGASGSWACPLPALPRFRPAPGPR